MSLDSDAAAAALSPLGKTHKSISGNQKRPMDAWGGGGFVLDISFVINKHQFLSTQNFQ